MLLNLATGSPGLKRAAGFRKNGLVPSFPFCRVTLLSLVMRQPESHEDQTEESESQQ